ncbi:MAG TPA: response regulator transcription factor [Anaerolineaceae bacterium]|nr:response regulator transcription factor [Anaerolineaceae bacterium]HPN51565.1 response regulator transcription factor [Anaerolineaceae bacterium]
MTPPKDSPLIRVLLADDHQVVRAGIRQFLEQAPDLAVIAEAGNGREALSLIEQTHPDVAVLDVQMPLMSGIDVVRRARELKLPVGLLILTAFDDEPYLRAALQAGAGGYVLKTAEPQEIIQAVRDVFHGRQALSAALAARLEAASDTGGSAAVSERELQILTLTAKGFTNKAIAVQLGISDRTVQNHLAHIFAKLQAESRTEAVMRAVSLNLLPRYLIED